MGRSICRLKEPSYNATFFSGSSRGRKLVKVTALECNNPIFKSNSSPTQPLLRLCRRHRIEVIYLVYQSATRIVLQNVVIQ
ncbi:unnamed protein product [Soboliphyme baturini]|uniref:C2 domain-containing protein n=1 Tax=Soboliphyme baturini TaxID=241478 RepID=A0A183IVH7_9BILA|nr:unnamed protein product [Soboliphyme baturini]